MIVSRDRGREIKKLEVARAKFEAGEIAVVNADTTPAVAAKVPIAARTTTQVILALGAIRAVTLPPATPITQR